MTDDRELADALAVLKQKDMGPDAKLTVTKRDGVIVGAEVTINITKELDRRRKLRESGEAS